MSLEDKNNTSGTGERARGVVDSGQGNETRSQQTLVVGKFTESEEGKEFIKNFPLPINYKFEEIPIDILFNYKCIGKIKID